MTMHHRRKIPTSTNTKEKYTRSGSKMSNAVIRVGQAIYLAVDRFVSIGEAIAEDNPEIKIDMYEVCRDARAAGAMIEQLCEIYHLESRHSCPIADKHQMVRAARSLLSSVTRVLLLTDTVVVKQLLGAKDRVSISLNRLENVANFTEFVKAFSHFGAEMVELARLTSHKQNVLKDERQHSQMIVTKKLLDRSAMMLLTSSKACLRHPDCETARENRDTVFIQIRRAIDLIHFIVKEGVIPDLATGTTNGESNQNGGYRSISGSIWQAEELEQCLTVHNAVKKFEEMIEMGHMTLIDVSYRTQLNNAFDAIVERTQDFTDSAYTTHEHREKILLLCDRIKIELSQLLREGDNLDQAGTTTPTDRLETFVFQTLQATKDLRQQLQDTALELSDELLKLRNETNLLCKMKHISMTGDFSKLEDYTDKFKEHVDYVQEVCKMLHHVAITEAQQISSKSIESCLQVYGPQVMSACYTHCLHPNSKIARENLDVFIDVWRSLVNDVTSLAYEINEYCQGHIPVSASNTSPQTEVTMTTLPPVTTSTITITTTTTTTTNVNSKSPQCMKLDVEEQASIAKLGLEMKMLTSEMDAETNKWPTTDNDIVRRARSMSQMAFSMYQFTRGEGELKTTQDLFTQAEFFAEEANKFYKVVRHFSYQVPGEPPKKELLEYLDRVPTFVQQLQFTVKNPTVGKAATFTKVDNVIKETKNLMNAISKVVTHCLGCATKYNLDFSGAGSDRSRLMAQYRGEGEEYVDPNAGMPPKAGVQSASDPNI
ncbi:alpha-catulin-like isoform X1 [Centruroides vittatus]|uniref:alpha-catulin-like isoform X1 n=2 Tax=Centruroides vittatus TaxID=120091 RepID=UPI00350FBD03